MYQLTEIENVHHPDLMDTGVFQIQIANLDIAVALGPLKNAVNVVRIHTVLLHLT